jgi:hypothetical protein
MAGSFGFRPDTYDVSVQIANLSLLPKVRGHDGGNPDRRQRLFLPRADRRPVGRETLHLA